jgi:hypothetical protein
MKKLRQRQDVGRTVITFASPITMRVLVGGSLGELTVPAATVNYVMSLSQFFSLMTPVQTMALSLEASTIKISGTTMPRMLVLCWLRWRKSW